MSTAWVVVNYYRSSRRDQGTSEAHTVRYGVLDCSQLYYDVCVLGMSVVLHRRRRGCDRLVSAPGGDILLSVSIAIAISWMLNTDMGCSTRFKAAATTLVLLMSSVIVISCFNCVASVSRLVWAFANDKGLPFGRYFIRVSVVLPGCRQF
jgi:hypothetical protein